MGEGASPDGTEASMDQTAELQLAAEMGQLLISQKRQLMQELDEIKGKNSGTFFNRGR